MAGAIRPESTSTVSSRRTVLTVLAGSTLAAACATAPGHATAPSAAFRGLRKAMWVWNFGSDDLDALAAFATAEVVDTIFLSLPAAMRADLATGNVRTVARLRALRQKGLSLMALTGDPSWVRSPERVPQSLKQILAAATHDKALFDGVSLDVEPNALPQWHNPSARPELLKGTLAFYKKVRALAGRTPIDAALNPAFAELRLSDGQNFLEALCRQLTSVSLMAYRNLPERAYERAAPAATIIEAVGLPWRLGVLVHATHEKATSYVDTDRATFEADMVKLDALERGGRGPSRNYHGLIFEDYNGLQRILRT